MERNIISKSFLIFLIVGIIYVCYKIFLPFLDEIAVAAILVSIFYVPYKWLSKVLRGRNKIAAFIMCVLVALLVILPLTNFIVYAANRSIVGYEKVLAYVNTVEWNNLSNNYFFQRFDVFTLDSETLKSFVLEAAKNANDWIVGLAGSIIKSTTNFFISLILIIFTMFFFFLDGEQMVKKIMYWTPLPNKYDKKIFKKFQDVSMSTVVSVFVTAIAQGLVAALGFLIIGFPAFFASIAVAVFSLLPYFGASLVWFPIVIYLLIAGKIWQAIFLLAWGGLVVGTIDNLIRAYIIKGKAQVHPIFIIFSVLGGIAFFGFWGIIFGPLVIALAVTILHIYELEYESVLER